jgi:hypothetical protein
LPLDDAFVVGIARQRTPDTRRVDGRVAAQTDGQGRVR